MATAYVKSGSGVTEFAQSTAYSLGQRIVPKRTDTGTNHLIGKRHVWECTTAGTSAGAEPTWPASVTIDTTTVTSNTAVFRARRPGFSSGTTANWTFATIYADYPGLLMAAGDTVYISNNHAESYATAFGGGTNTSALQNLVNYICVDDSAAPPTALATTATITSTAAAITFSASNANPYVYGVIFTGFSAITLTGFFEQSSFRLSQNATGLTISTAAVSWKNCTVKFAHAGQAISGTSGGLYWSGGSLLSGGTSPTSLFLLASTLRVEDVDLSNAAAAINLVGTGGTATRVDFFRMKLPASWSGALFLAAMVYTQRAEMHSGDTAGTNYQYRKKITGGETFSETTIVRTGGATDGTTQLSHKIVTVSFALFPGTAGETPDLVKWNNVTGSAINVTVELVHDSVTALTDKECWMEVHYYSASGSPLGAMISSAGAPIASAGTSLTSSSETWTTTGMTNPNKRKITLSFTPQLKGFISAKVFLAKASTTAYVCPKLTVT